MALSDSNRRANLNIPKLNGEIIHSMASLEDNVKTENFDSIEVDIRLLDSFCFENIGFIKIDVEGHELHVLKGAKHLLRLQKPVLLIEMEQRHLTSGSVYDAFSFLQQIGYRVYF